MSPKFKKVSREIDTVTVKGSVKPVQFFTVNLQEDDIMETPDRFKVLSTKEKKQMRSLEKSTILEQLIEGTKTTGEILARDEEWMELRKFQNEDFDKIFAQAYINYIKGDWPRAEDLLVNCLRISPNDGPSRTLKNTIEAQNGSAPSGWKGYRELTEK
jgi:hypothetical protein